jgi:hypothetical protein
LYPAKQTAAPDAAPATLNCPLFAFKVGIVDAGGGAGQFTAGL